MVARAEIFQEVLMCGFPAENEKPSAIAMHRISNVDPSNWGSPPHFSQGPISPVGLAARGGSGQVGSSARASMPGGSLEQGGSGQTPLGAQVGSRAAQGGSGQGSEAPPSDPSKRPQRSCGSYGKPGTEPYSLKIYYSKA